MNLILSLCDRRSKIIKKVTYYSKFNVEDGIFILYFKETIPHRPQIIAELAIGINCQFFVIDFMIEHSSNGFLLSVR